MSDLPTIFRGGQDEEETPQNAPAATLHPDLEQFQGALQTGAGQDWGREATTRIQDFLNQRQIVDANTAASSQFVNNLDQFKTSLVDMVKSDPTSAKLALDLVPLTVKGLVENHPYLPEGSHQDTHDQIVDHIQQTVAQAAVMSMAEKHEPAARSLLDQLSGFIGTANAEPLNGYIDAMATARNIDNQAQAQNQFARQQTFQEQRALQYFSALVEKNGDLKFPESWAQSVMKDPALPPGATAVFIAEYENLRKHGDGETNPRVVQELVNDIALDREKMSIARILSYTGNGLKLVDALTLARLARPSNESAQLEGAQGNIDRFKNVLALAHAQIVGKDGENGAAGEYAFDRFVKWFMPSYRNAGPANIIDPQTLASEIDQHFLPNGDDLRKGPYTTAQMYPVEAMAQTQPAQPQQPPTIIRGPSKQFTDFETLARAAGYSQDMIDRLKARSPEGLIGPTPEQEYRALQNRAVSQWASKVLPSPTKPPAPPKPPEVFPAQQAGAPRARSMFVRSGGGGRRARRY